MRYTESEEQLTLKEVDSLVGNQVTRQVLRGVHTTNNKSTVEISALPQLNQVRLLDSLLKIDSPAHHSHRLRGIKPSPASQTGNRLLSLLEAPLADEPPGRLGSQKQQDRKRGGEHPLQRDRDPVRDVLEVLVIMIRNTRNNNRPDGPEHLQHLRRRGAQLDGRDLGAIRGCVGDEDAPGDTLQELCDKHDGERVRKVEDEDEGVQQHEARDGGPSVSDLAGEGASEQDTDDGTDGPAHLEGGLPAGLDDELVLYGAVYAVVVRELGEGDEATGEEDTVGFHDLHA